jgi:hypothetical protein
VKVFVRSVGLLGPGMESWSAARGILRGDQAHTSAKTKLTPPARLPPAERRRAGDAIKLAMAVADEAVTSAAIDPQTLATVFASSSGEGVNCHNICETLAGADRAISPTRFTNSVHNAPSGYWHIAVASRAPSTSLCAFDGSFAAGLVEAAAKCLSMNVPVLLVASDTPYPEPLHATRPLADGFGVALLLAPEESADALAALDIALIDAAGDSASAQPISRCDGASLEFLRAHTPAAHALPLLQALARGVDAPALSIDYLPSLRLRVGVRCLRAG